MSTPGSKYVPYLDGWRGLAICFLLIGHFFPVPGINFGLAGVNLFFVLSGFLMARLLFIDAVPIPTFYKRRCARILPAVACFLTLIVLGWLAFGKKVDWTEVATAAAFLNNYFPGPPGAAVMPFGHIWSLCVEEHSYILLSVVAVAARAKLVPAKVMVGLFATLFAAAGVGYWLSYQGPYLSQDRWIHSEVSAYGIFVSAFLVLALRDRKMARLPTVVLPSLVALGFALHWWSVPDPVRTIAGVGAFALAINLLQMAPNWIHQVLSLRPLRQMGLWSFSIYLWQQPFYLSVAHGRLSPWAGTALAIVVGICSFYVLENPARIYLNRKWARGKDAGSPQEVLSSSPATQG